MNVSLTPELEQFIDAKVKTGFYHSASEVVREGLRMLAEQDAIKQKRLEMLTHDIDQGLASQRSGNVLSGSDVYQQLVERRKS